MTSSVEFDERAHDRKSAESERICKAYRKEALEDAEWRLFDGQKVAGWKLSDVVECQNITYRLDLLVEQALICDNLELIADEIKSRFRALCETDARLSAWVDGRCHELAQEEKS